MPEICHVIHDGLIGRAHRSIDRVHIFLAKFPATSAVSKAISQVVELLQGINQLLWNAVESLGILHSGGEPFQWIISFEQLSQDGPHVLWLFKYCFFQQLLESLVNKSVGHQHISPIAFIAELLDEIIEWIGTKVKHKSNLTKNGWVFAIDRPTKPPKIGGNVRIIAKAY
jgi:hypothetical protein